MTGHMRRGLAAPGMRDVFSRGPTRASALTIATPPEQIRLLDVASQLKRLRRSRRVSQMSLALSAGVSARHVSFVETGRARPGRDVLLRLSDALELTDDEARSLLAAGGFGPIRTLARPPSAAQLAPLLDPIRGMLARLEPLPAVLLDARWDLLMPNAAYVRILKCMTGASGFPGGPLQLTDPPRPNRLCELLSPALHNAIENWDDLVPALLSRMQAEACLSGDPVLQELLDQAMTAPGVLPACRKAASRSAPRFPIRADLRVGRSTIRFFSIVTAWATDLPGLRIEFLHPVDERAERALGALARGACTAARDATRRATRLQGGSLEGPFSLFRPLSG